MRVLTERLIEEMDVATIVLELFEEHHRMDIVASESIGACEPKMRKSSLPDAIAESIQTRPVESCSAIAIIAKDMLGEEGLSWAVEMSSKPLNLLLNGLGEHLTIGRYADIDSRSHSWSPFGGEQRGGKGACRRA